MTREELAVAVGCSAPSIGNHERGLHAPTERVLFRLCQELGIPVEELRHAS
jgi:transcriptional regulator with XRE-family HTH domain